MKRNDKGFSLIELIVVIALMAVAMTVSGMALSNITLANAKRCATEIKSTMEAVRLESLRTTASSKPVLCVYEDADGNIMLKTASADAEGDKIASSSVKVYFVNGSGEKTSLGTSGVTFEFDRSSGAMKNQSEVVKLIVSGAGREYTLTCYPKTGKVIME